MASLAGNLQTGSGNAPAPTRAQLASVAMGNALEFYDFLIFSFFAVQIGQTFFPATNPVNSLLAALATFGAGFLTRPLGAYVIGRYGDRAGRKPAMLLSFALIGLSSLSLALVPSYAALGMTAPVLVIIGRLVQGFALGGEVGPSSAFLAEAGAANRRGRLISLQMASQGLAMLASGIVGMTLSVMLSEAALTNWGWRVALALGALIVPVGLLLRRTLPETLESSAQSGPTPFRSYGRIAVLGFMILLAGTISTYVMSYLTTYSQTVLGLSPKVAFGAAVAGGLAYTLGALWAGWACDRWGRRLMMIGPATLGVIATIPAFMLLNARPGEATLYSVAFLLRFILVAGMTAGFIALTEGLPVQVRSAALALVYALAISVFGGSTQFVIAWLTEWSGDPMAPAWYMLVALIIGLVAMILMRETGEPRTAPPLATIAAA
jgi:MFS family permease